MECNKLNKLPIICIFSHPRSLSTILFRALMNNPLTIPMFEEFIHFYIQKDYKGDTFVSKTKEDFLLEYEQKVLEIDGRDRYVLQKDPSYIIAIEYLDFFKEFSKKYDLKIIHLIRHPKPSLKSFFTQLDNDPNCGKELAEESKKTPIYDLSWQVYKELGGRVIITEDLQSNPAEVMKEIYEYIGLEFSESLLKFKPLIQIGIPDEWKRINLSWFENALYSTEIKKGRTDIDSIVIDNEELSKAIETQMEFYNNFVEVRSAYFS